MNRSKKRITIQEFDTLKTLISSGLTNRQIKAIPGMWRSSKTLKKIRLAETFDDFKESVRAENEMYKMRRELKKTEIIKRSRDRFLEKSIETPKKKDDMSTNQLLRIMLDLMVSTNQAVLTTNELLRENQRYLERVISNAVKQEVENEN